MIDETKVKKDVGTEDHDQAQQYNGGAGNQMDNYG